MIKVENMKQKNWGQEEQEKLDVNYLFPNEEYEFESYYYF
jgi:hypothetical protein